MRVCMCGAMCGVRMCVGVRTLDVVCCVSESVHATSNNARNGPHLHVVHAKPDKTWYFQARHALQTHTDTCLFYSTNLTYKLHSLPAGIQRNVRPQRDSLLLPPRFQECDLAAPPRRCIQGETDGHAVSFLSRVFAFSFDLLARSLFSFFFPLCSARVPSRAKKICL